MKTAVAITREGVLSAIPGTALRDAYTFVLSVGTGTADALSLASRAQAVHDLQVYADQLRDVADAIGDAVKSAQGAYFVKAGKVTEGFRLKDNGSTSCIKDVPGFVAEAERNGANLAELVNYVSITPKNAAKWLGMSDDAFALTYEEFIETKPKAKSLQREY